jgi:hypothetical protein
VLHRKVPPFGATPPAVHAARGHLIGMQPNLDSSRGAIKQFRYSFRQSLLETVQAGLVAMSPAI